MQNKKGFTLIELIITITLIGMMVGVAIPRLTFLSRNVLNEKNFNDKYNSVDVKLFLKEQHLDEDFSYSDFLNSKKLKEKYKDWLKK
jgi:prepilin-type N-terminal cleavage/methylation domain-containing protein